MMLLSLPPELIQAISHELKSIEDVKSFRLACKQTDEVLATDLLRRITVDINTETFERELRKLQYLASAALKGSSSRLAIQGIREIDIKSLSPALNPKEYWSWQNNPGLETLHYEAILKKCLYKALSSLTTVRTIRWLPAQKDSEWAQIAIVNALKTFSHLQNLSVELRYCRIEIPFHLFTALKHVSLHCVGRENSFYYRGKTIENLIKMISESPRLESIDLTNNGGFPSTKSLIRSLHQLFERYPEDVSPLRLKHLSLTSFLVRLDDETVIRHLRYLTSLSLKDILQPLPPYPSGHDNDNPIFKDISETSNRWGSSCEQIWGMILNANLRLEEISVDNIPSTFVEYIGSYSGLKKLIVFVERFQDEVASERVGKKFYEALEMHASSIEELDVRAYFEGVWCFGHHNKTLFSTFKNLKTLSVRLQSSDFIRRSELEHSSRQDIIEVLIDTVVKYMPQLHALSASISNTERSRHNTGVMGIDRHHMYYNKNIVARILKYKAPWDCKRLPMFTVGPPFTRLRVFVGNLLKEGERLGYNDISPPVEYPTEEDSSDTTDDEE